MAYLLEDARFGRLLLRLSRLMVMAYKTAYRGVHNQSAFLDGDREGRLG